MCAEINNSVRDGELQTHSAARAHRSLEDQKKHEKKNMSMIRKKKKKKKKKKKEKRRMRKVNVKIVCMEIRVTHAL